MGTKMLRAPTKVNLNAIGRNDVTSYEVGLVQACISAKRGA
jgi:hypothetical protein